MGKYPVQKPYFWILKKCLFLLGISLISGLTFANPVVDRITSGNVSIQQTPGNTVINQSSSRAIINWRSFNIGAGEKTHFQQPIGGAALNRIDPTQGASQIYGNLSATGKIILINQAGIYFGPTARVDVGGIIASTSDMSDANFLADKYIFDQPSPYAGSIVNEGTIVAAKNGLVALVGTAVQNDGTIEANLGSVVLASGNKFTVDLAGDQLINFTIDEETATVGKSPIDGKPMKHAVNNTGSVIADGGKIIMSANVAKGVLDNVINMSGVAQARSVKFRKGEIILSAKTGKVTVSGKLIATGNYKKQKGGTIKVLGERVHIKAPAVIDASGNTGGGTILIGGNYQGKGPELNAKDTYIEKGAVIKADALMNGNGGTIVAWADEGTWAYGDFSAMGGSLGGNGGFIETSGKNYLDVTGIKVNTLAPNGKTGTWLLDPRNVTISGAATTGGAFAVGVFTPTSDDANVNIADIGTALNTTNVEITTGSTGTQDGNIDIATGNFTADWTSGNSLTLNAANDINVLSAVTWTTSGSLIFTAGGNVNIIANITNTTNSGANFTVTAGVGKTINFSSNPTISILGTQTYNSPVFIGTDAFFNSTTAAPPYPASGNVIFNSTIQGTRSLTIVAGTAGVITFNGDVGTFSTPLGSIELGGLSSSQFQPGSISIFTTNNQTYNMPVFLQTGTNVNLTSTSGTINFTPDVGDAVTDLLAIYGANSGNSNISVSAPTAITVHGNIGQAGQSQIDSLTLSGSSILLKLPSPFGFAPGIYTSGNQIYNTAVTFETGTVNQLIFTSDTGSVSFSSTLSDVSSGNSDLSITASTISLSQGLGSSVPFNTFTSNGSLVTIGEIKTVGNQAYNNLVTVSNSSTATFTSTGGDIAFNNNESLTGDGNAVISTPALNSVSFFGGIGITTPLLGLQIDGGRVEFTGTSPQSVFANVQVYNSLMRLNSSDVILSTGPISSGSGSISINGPISPFISAAQTLTLTGSGNGDHNFTLAGGLFGGSPNPLGSLIVTGSNGSGNDTLTLQTNASTQTWNVTGNKSGDIALTGGNSSILSFTFGELESLVGGANNDSFVLTGSGVITSIDGGTLGTKFLNLSGISSDNAMTLTQLGSSVGFNGTATAGVTNFSNITDYSNTTGTSNSLANNGLDNGVWTINTTNGGSLLTQGRTWNFSNVQSLIGGSLGDTFNFSSGVTLSSITGDVNATNTMNFTGNPVTLVFTSTRNGTATTSGGSTLFTYSNIDQAQGSSSGTVQLPTTTTNTLTINADGSGSFSDPFIFNNTNNGFINFIGNSTDDIIFNGFTPSFTTVGSTSVSTQINGATYTFSGFGLIPTPAPTPTPNPTPIPIPIPDEALNSEVVQATTTNSSSNTGIHATGETTLASFIYENAVVDQIVADMDKNNIFENQPLKINLNCGI